MKSKKIEGPWEYIYLQWEGLSHKYEGECRWEITEDQLCTWPHCVTCYDSRKQNKNGNFSLFLIDLSIVAIYMKSGGDVYESVVNFIFKLSLL